MRFRGISAEAVHRHNFPALCRKPRPPGPKAGETLVWTRTPDGEHNGRPTYEYTAVSGDREYFITWAYDAGFGFTAVRRDPKKPGTVEYLTERHGIIWARTLKRCKFQCEEHERKHSGT